MGMVKFINKVTQLLQLEEFEPKESDKKSIKILLKKLAQRRHKLKKKLKKEIKKSEREDAQEEIDIITVQIQKGTKILKELKK